MTAPVQNAAIALLFGIALSGTAAGAAEPVVPDTVDRLMRADRECIDYDASHMRNARETAQLTANHTLYLLPCYTGAYNVIYRVYVVDKRYPDELRRSLFAGFSDENGWYGKDSLINASFDPATRTLTAFEKGRGLGDCGSEPVYRWNEYDWRMIEYRHWGKCDGSRMPEKWPVIYRGKAAR